MDAVLRHRRGRLSGYGKREPPKSQLQGLQVEIRRGAQEQRRATGGNAGLLPQGGGDPPDRGAGRAPPGGEHEELY